jgi:short-subunit dehydrogenase
MKLKDARIILTGATGGIGQALSHELAGRGARLGLVGRRQEKLQALAKELVQFGAEVEPIIADLSDSHGREQVVTRMQARFGGVDVLINNAGMSAFTQFAQCDSEVEERLLRTNVLAPMQLCRAVLPEMTARGSGRIVNIGSTFGSIAFACFVGYSTSKFALRGFSEALRRELDGSGVTVAYLAPRAVKTEINTPAVMRMAERVKMNMDDPAYVAKSIVRAIEKDRKDVYLGFPEALFVRLNALFPRLVDGALRKQNQIMREFTQGTEP